MVSNGVRLERVSALASCVTQPLYVSALMGFNIKKSAINAAVFLTSSSGSALVMYTVYIFYDFFFFSSTDSASLGTEKHGGCVCVCVCARVCVCQEVGRM